MSATKSEFSMSSRPLCAQCLRPPRACWCGCVQAIHSDVQVLVLQHPMEAGHAKNTARLLHQCVPGSQLQVGEVFEPDALQHWLHAPWSSADTTEHVRTVLLYPQTPHDPQLPVLQPPALPSAWLESPQGLRLVVIDGTWRKSRKMLYLNPALQHLPRLALNNVPQGRYAIRKAHAPGQLSSFEAAALALAQLHGWSEEHPIWQQLMHSFDSVIALHQQLQAQGSLLNSHTEGRGA